MAFVVQGVRLDELSITVPDNEGVRRLSGQYALLGPTGKVIAKQPFNQQYGGFTVDWSPKTKQMFDALLASMLTDLNVMIGMEPAP